MVVSIGHSAHLRGKNLRTGAKALVEAEVARRKKRALVNFIVDATFGYDLDPKRIVTREGCLVKKQSFFFG